MTRRSSRFTIRFALLAAVVAVGVPVAWVMLPPGALGFAGGPTVELSAYRGPSPAGVPADLRGADIVARGSYLAKAAGCGVCHTATDGKAYAGGRAFTTPFGILYAPNITADTATGIGDWSNADFLRAMHQGIAKDGSHLYPAFPFESYTLLADDDVLAIKAYLFSLPRVHATPPTNTLTFPFNQRWLMALWSALYNSDARFRPHVDRSAAWNRGAYISEALTHCGDCHTPRNLAQAPDNRRKYAGALIEGWRAYNITADASSGIGRWSDGELASYLVTGHAAGRGAAGGPMATVVDTALRQLAPADINAIVTYLRSVPAIATPALPAPRATEASSSPQVMAAGFDPRGKQIFEGACVSCHGWTGRGPLTDAATLTGNRAVNDSSATNVVQIVLSGALRQTPSGIVLMPAFGRAYSDIDIAAVANYVTARFGVRPSKLDAESVARLRATNPF